MARLDAGSKFERWSQPREARAALTAPEPRGPDGVPETGAWRLERPLCITGEPLDPMRIALDHFLPRSYVGHDRIWNLVPVAPANNSRKGARLPHREAVGRLVEFHFAAIETASNGHAPNWRKYWEEYASDLRVDPERLLEPGVLADAYIGTIYPMLDIAKRMGFPEGWPMVKT